MSGKRRPPIYRSAPDCLGQRNRDDSAKKLTKQAKEATTVKKGEEEGDEDICVEKAHKRRRLLCESMSTQPVRHATRIQAAFRGWQVRARARLRHAAACRIQRWFRNQRCVVWSGTSARVMREWRAHGHVHLVEPCGACYTFHAWTLAALFLASADFRHPVTRRALVPPEFRRISRALAPGARVCLEFTWGHAQEARQALYERDSLLEFLTSEAAKSLDAAVELAEDAEAVAQFREALEAYEDSVHDIQARLPVDAAEALAQHGRLIGRRLRRCNENAASELLDTHRMLTFMSGRARKQAPQAAVTVWMMAVVESEER